MLQVVSACAIMLEHDVDAGGRSIKFELFLQSSPFQMEKGMSCSHPYDPYVAWHGNKRDRQNSVKFRNSRLIVQIEA